MKNSRIINFLLKGKAHHVIPTIVGALLLLALVAYSFENLVYDKAFGVNLDYDGFPDNQIAIVFDAELRRCARHSVVTRDELREYLEEKPVIVRFNPRLSSRGFAQQRGSHTSVQFSNEDPTDSIIRHEAVHVCLYAASVPEHRHHAIMENGDTCYDHCS